MLVVYEDAWFSSMYMWCTYVLSPRRCHDRDVSPRALIHVLAPVIGIHLRQSLNELFSVLCYAFWVCICVYEKRDIVKTPGSHRIAFEISSYRFSYFALVRAQGRTMYYMVSGFGGPAGVLGKVSAAQGGGCGC